ncbi:MAG TPA: ATP-dependent helicase [Acidimicrobiales bacterium]|nr:ATP-dependent helicase [Acidimicrobiales bacterium]
MFVPAATDTRPWDTGLNQAQRDAVTHDGGPLLVVAGAGTGKTLTLASRVGRLVDEGTDPDRILLLTFSRRAAREMLRRAEHLGASGATGRVWSGTFHAIGNRLLREHGRAVGLSASFTILDQGDAADLIGVVRAELGMGERGKRFPKKHTLLDIYSRVANAQEPLTDVLRERFPWCRAEIDDLRTVFTAYAERKRTRGVLDYDDLLLYWRALVRDGTTAGHLRHRFDHVLVDEYQDTNLLQADIVAGLTREGRGLFCVGDDAQAIYGFRAASAANMADFPTRWADARVLTLDRNYRSVQPVLDVANAVMAGARDIYPKELRAARDVVAAARPMLAQAGDEGAEAVFVCERVLEHRELGTALLDQCVLFRTGHHSARLEVELSRRNIPFVKFGGLKFLETAHVRDLVALLRVLENPSDELAWHRILGLCDGVGPATMRLILDHLDLDTPGALVRLVESPPDLPPRAVHDVELLRTTFAHCLAGTGTGSGPAVDVELLRTELRPLFEGRYPDAATRLTDLEQLQAIAAASPTRAHLLSELVIDPPSRTSDLAGPPHLDDDYLILSTVHSAKGGEWDVVFLIHASDGNIPSDMALSTPEGLEEERRLLYVALTRARDHLYVTHPLRYYHHPRRLDDGHDWAQPSRFLSGLRGFFDEPAVDHAVSLAVAVDIPTGPDPVAGQLASLWA